MMKFEPELILKPELIHVFYTCPDCGDEVNQTDDLFNAVYGGAAICLKCGSIMEIDHVFTRECVE